MAAVHTPTCATTHPSLPFAAFSLDASDFTPDARPLVLNERLWRERFNGDPKVVGKSVRIDGASWTIVGVMPQATTVGTIEADAWSTQPLDRATARQLRSYYLAMIGRLRPGIRLDAANAELVRGAGSRFDPTVVHAWLRSLDGVEVHAVGAA